VRSAAPAELAPYRAIVLLSVGAPAQAGLWDKLAAYVEGGGGLLIVPGGDELQRADYAPDASRGLIPAELEQILNAGDQGVAWIEYQYQHPLIAPWRDYAQNPETKLAEKPPRTFRYWAVKPVAGANVL